MMTARDREGSALGFFVAAWAGHNHQSHNHNDVGNAVVFVDQEPSRGCARSASTGAGTS